MKIVDLNDVTIRADVLFMWKQKVATVMFELMLKGVSPGSFEEERFRVYDNGEAEIFAKINDTEIKLKLSPDQWSYVIEN